MTLTADRLQTTHELVERMIGRRLTASERAIDILGLNAALNREKDALHQAIEDEKRTALSAVRRGRRPYLRLRITRQMLLPLERLHRLGRDEAYAELQRLGYQPRRRMFAEDAASKIDPVAELAGRLRVGLSDLAIRLEGERVSLETGGMAAEAIARALLRVPGGRDLASQVVSTALTSGLTLTFEANEDLVPCWQYTAVMDAGTCSQCSALDGREYHSLAALYRVLPNFGPHPGCYGRGRCRCRAVPCPPDG